MKKNAMLKIAAILMVAVLLTTCAISSTFAKYTTSGNDSTSARVAKWGVAVDTAIFADANSAENDLFFTEYGESAATGESKHVEATANVVAPGTSGSMNIDNIATGTPEVSGKVVVAATVDLNDAWVVDGNFYCPLEFTINGVTVDGRTATSEADLQSKFGTALTETLYFDAGESVNEAIDFSIAWEWDFEVEGETAAKNAANVKDTYLAGTNADGTLRDGYVAPTITIGLTITIEQTGAAGVHATEAP